MTPRFTGSIYVKTMGRPYVNKALPALAPLWSPSLALHPLPHPHKTALENFLHVLKFHPLLQRGMLSVPSLSTLILLFGKKPFPFPQERLSLTCAPSEPGDVSFSYIGTGEARSRDEKKSILVLDQGVQRLRHRGVNRLQVDTTNDVRARRSNRGLSNGAAEQETRKRGQIPTFQAHVGSPGPTTVIANQKEARCQEEDPTLDIGVLERW